MRNDGLLSQKHKKTLASVLRMVPSAVCIDPLVGDWLLNPDVREKTCV